MNFGEKLRMLRKEKGLSQKETAIALGLSLRTYAAYELNQRIPRTKKKSEEIAAFFGRTADYLLLNANPIEYLMREYVGVQQPQFAKSVIKELEKFLLCLDWQTSISKTAGEDIPSCLIAENDNVRLVFAMYPIIPFGNKKERFTLEMAYGTAAILPISPLETHYIIVSDSAELGRLAETLPCNLSFPASVFQFDMEKGDFLQKEIFRLISKHS